MAKVKVTISMPKELCDEAKRTNKKLSHLLSEALEEYLRREKIKKAKSSFGAWKRFEGESTEFVRKLREKDERLKRLGFDTDIAIDYLRGKEEVKEILERLWDEGKAYLSVISVYELSCGMREGEEEMTEAFIDRCEVVEVNRSIALEAGRLYREY